MVRESILPFILGVSLVTFLFVIDFIFDYLNLILSKGIPPLVVLELFLLALGWITALSVPTGVLVAALMTFGRLSQDNEITALRGLGVNPGRTLAAPILGALFLTGALVAFNHYILPETNHRFANLTMAITRKAPTAHITAGVFVNAFEDYSFLAREVNSKTGEMRDITIYDYSQGQLPTTILARTGKMEYIENGATLKLDLMDGEVHEVPGEANEGKYRKLRFDTQTLFMHNPGAVLKRTAARNRGDREMNLHQLMARVKRNESQRDTRLARIEERIVEAGYPSYKAFNKQHGRKPNPPWYKRLLGVEPVEADSTQVDRSLLNSVRMDELEVERLERRRDNIAVEVYKKVSIPFACIAFVLLGAPLGIRLRKGGFANMAVAVAGFMTYYLLLLGGEQLADRRLLPPLLAMWLPNILLGGVGLYLTLSIMGRGPSRGMR